MDFKYVWEHLYLVSAAIVFTVIVGLFLGIVAYMIKPLRTPILWIADLLQTVPVLALLGIIMIFFGASSTTVIIGIVLYSLLPVVRNTYVGLTNIDPGIKESARGMGMTRIQRLIKVEFPLSFPIIFTGVRISLVTSIGIAVFGAFVGGGGLGATINRAILLQDMNTLIQVTVTLMVMAVGFDILMGYIEKRLKAR
ncbi:osmoprotectant transport system permease protein [Desulfitispora alkaliphila]|uniref:ABC transporter permease n=1 Tax=Desulfitispora alkaliphila TaxID=622674 RepID=UPI003D1EFA7D